MSQATSTHPLYEGLFLLSQSAASDLNAATEHLKHILTRGEAEILVLRKWEERRLAYPIKGQKRGTYLIAYFHVPPQQLPNMERALNLSENILRSMILRADHVGEVELDMAKRGERLWETEQKLRGEEESGGREGRSRERGRGRGREKPATEQGDTEGKDPAAEQPVGGEDQPAGEASEPSQTPPPQAGEQPAPSTAQQD